MSNKLIYNYFFILFSIIPISILFGPTISLINIILLDISFLILLILKKDWDWMNNPIIKLIFLLFFYLIFNSFISLDYTVGILRNIGFIRFIILFLAFNYFFYKYENFHKFLIFWIFVIFVVCCDIYFESLMGRNILGFQGYGDRVVSFFKNEPIIGGYMNAFYFLCLGFLFLNYENYPLKYRSLIIVFSIFLCLSILLTGERSNTIKSFIGIIIFYFLNKNFSFKEKFLSIFVILIIAFGIYQNSDYLKRRYSAKTILGTVIGDRDEVTKIAFKEKVKIFTQDNVYFKIYLSGIEVFKNYPYFGVGNKNYRVEACNEIASFGSNYRYYCVTHPHQVYIEFLSEHGIFGTIILLSILFYLIFRLLKVIILSKNSLQQGCFAYLLVVFLPFLPGGAFFGDYNSTLFWINISILYAANRETNIFIK